MYIFIKIWNDIAYTQQGLGKMFDIKEDPQDPEAEPWVLNITNFYIFIQEIFYNWYNHVYVYNTLRKLEWFYLNYIDFYMILKNDLN